MIYKTYLGLPNINKPILIHKIINRGYLFIFKNLFDKKLREETEKLKLINQVGINKETRAHTIDVSLTSFPARINEVSTTVETIFSQTLKADSITLYLSLKQFPNKDIPDALSEQIKRGLTIVFVEDDLRSHKKYFYSFSKQLNNLIVTFDDDVFYPKNTIETLLEAHLKYPDAIICNRGHKINFSKNKVLDYKLWYHNYQNKKPSLASVPTGVGGVLYPPNSYSKDIYDIDTFKSICFFADDLWLKIHSLRVGTKVMALRTFSRDLISVGKSQDFKLAQHNAVEGGNNVQFKKLLEYYNITEKDFIDAT